MFDIAKLDIATASDEGRPMPIRNPRGEVVRHESGDPVTINLLGRHSERARAKERELANRRLEAAKMGKQRTPEDFEVEAVEYLQACTVGWSFTEMDGKPFPCTPENAKKFWSDRRFSNIRVQADNWISEDANFMRG